jgi:hypothetical protein
MTPVVVTQHAIQRYRERIDASLSDDRVREIILASRAAIEFAANFRCATVRISTGAKLVLCGTTVVTVLGRRQFAPPARLIEGAPA